MRLWLLVALLLAFLVPVMAGVPSFAGTDVNVNIGINAPPPVVVPPPPPYVVPGPPEVVVIPGTYVYFVPGVDVEILFYRGHWYRPHAGHWFRARSYNGPWVNVPPGRVPPALVSIPGNYRTMPPGHNRIPYGQLKKNWSRWERERYWDNHREWREEGHRGRHEGWGHEEKGPEERGHGHEGR